MYLRTIFDGEHEYLEHEKQPKVKYNIPMYNWSVQTSRLKQKPEEFEKFFLEQSINFGLNNKKLSTRLLKKHWNSLVLDPVKKAFLRKVLWKQP